MLTPGLVCLDHHGPTISYPQLHQALASLPLPPPLPRQPEMASHRLVGKPHVHNTMDLWLYWLLHVSMLAGGMVLEAILQEV